MSDLSAQEQFFVSVMRRNKSNPPKEWRRKFVFWRITAEFQYRSKRNLWGRFGGGWNWRLGFMAGGRTLILNLLVATLRIELLGRKMP